MLPQYHSFRLGHQPQSLMGGIVDGYQGGHSMPGMNPLSYGIGQDHLQRLRMQVEMLTLALRRERAVAVERESFVQDLQKRVENLESQRRRKKEVLSDLATTMESATATASSMTHTTTKATRPKASHEGSKKSKLGQPGKISSIDVKPGSKAADASNDVIVDTRPPVEARETNVQTDILLSGGNNRGNNVATPRSAASVVNKNKKVPQTYTSGIYNTLSSEWEKTGTQGGWEWNGRKVFVGSSAAGIRGVLDLRAKKEFVKGFSSSASGDSEITLLAKGRKYESTSVSGQPHVGTDQFYANLLIDTSGKIHEISSSEDLACLQKNMRESTDCQRALLVAWVASDSEASKAIEPKLSDLAYTYSHKVLTVKCYIDKSEIKDPSFAKREGVKVVPTFIGYPPQGVGREACRIIGTDEPALTREFSALASLSGLSKLDPVFEKQLAALRSKLGIKYGTPRQISDRSSFGLAHNEDFEDRESEDEIPAANVDSKGEDHEGSFASQNTLLEEISVMNQNLIVQGDQSMASEPQAAQVKGEWTLTQSGGPLSAVNPMILLTFEDPGVHRATISLEKVGDFTKKRTGIIFYVFSLDSHDAQALSTAGNLIRRRKDNPVGTGRLWFGYPDDIAEGLRLNPKYKSKATRRSSTKLTVTVRGSGRSYLILPCLERAGETGQFMISVTSRPNASRAENAELDYASPQLVLLPSLTRMDSKSGRWDGISAQPMQPFADPSDPTLSAPHVCSPQFPLQFQRDASSNLKLADDGWVLVTVKCNKSLVEGRTLHVFVYEAIAPGLRRRTFPQNALVAAQDGFVSSPTVTVAVRLSILGKSRRGTGSYIISCCLRQEYDLENDHESFEDFKYPEGSFEVVINYEGGTDKHTTAILGDQLPDPLPLTPKTMLESQVKCDHLVSKLRRNKLPDTGDMPGVKQDWGYVTLEADPLPEIIKYLESMEADQSATPVKFLDESFPPDDKSVNRLSNDTQLKYDRWMRISDFCDLPSVFKDGIDPDDVIQGVLGNCWFCGAMASVAWSRPQAIRNLFSPLSLETSKHKKSKKQKKSITPRMKNACFERGCFSIQILDVFADCPSYRWIVVDDYIPVDSYFRPVFARCRDPNEVWVILLEKCFAKLHGSYQSMAGHSSFCLRIGPGIRSMTGANVTRVCPADMPRHELWNILKDTLHQRGIMECSTRKHQETANMGLVCYHAYSVVGLSKLGDGTMLLRIRNTWGHSEWLGKWSDEDDENWTELAKRQVDDYVDADDGSFYMEIDDFCIHYDRLYFGKFVPQQAPRNLKGSKSSFITRSLSLAMGGSDNLDYHEDPFPYKTTQKGYWLRPYAGGFSCRNPQYLLQFSKSDDEEMDSNSTGGDTKKVRMVLQIPESQFSQDSCIGHTLSLVAVSCLPNQETGLYSRVSDLEGIIKQSTVIGSENGVSRSATLILSLSAKVGACIVIPCWERLDGNCNEKCDEGSFKVSVESSWKFNVKQLLAQDAMGKGSTKDLDNDFGRLHIVPADITRGDMKGSILNFEDFSRRVRDLGNSAQESCTIM